MADHGMNESTQKRQIQRFLKGNDKRDIDAFCIYQWIERCHIQEWWEMAVELSPYITPGALNTDYQKRLDFILKDCRIKQDASSKKATWAGTSEPRDNRIPLPTRKIIRNIDSPSGLHPSGSVAFENASKETLRQIYSVLYYMGKKYDFVAAVHHTKDEFNITYQTVDDKCARRFAGTVDIFQRWYRNGEILQRLNNHFHLSHHDYKIFKELLTKKSS